MKHRSEYEVNDTYIFKPGYGKDDVADDGGDADSLRLGFDINNVTFEKPGNSLSITSDLKERRTA